MSTIFWVRFAVATAIFSALLLGFQGYILSEARHWLEVQAKNLIWKLVGADVVLAFVNGFLFLHWVYANVAYKAEHNTKEISGSILAGIALSLLGVIVSIVIGVMYAGQALYKPAPVTETKDPQPGKWKEEVKS
ncbi:MAG TPA: hypothetical protein VEA59_04890 [Patescibacteria group bacterium]|nr:hypothetical protein [Patescibacteria group bacterium]